MSQPRYAPRRARLKLSLTRTVTSAAALAALALVCGPVLEGSGDSEAAAVTALSGPDSLDTTSSAPAPAAATRWIGALPIQPSRITMVIAAGDGAPSVESAPIGPPGPVGAVGIPLMVLRAYHLAADRLAVEQPSCRLPWWLLAGIGHTESGHAEAGRLTADGTTRGRILGPRLNGGIAGDAIITDTDHGSYDGDTVYDRAVGPMQFIPSTWVRWGADGNADGKRDPSNIFDATLAAGRYLCAGNRDLATNAGLKAAVLSYNHSVPYLATVLAWGAAYRDGASALPDSPLPVVGDVTVVRPPVSSRPPKPATGPTKVTSTASASPSASAPSQSSAAASSSASSSPSGSASSSCPTTDASPTGSSPTQSASGSSTAQSATAQSATARPTGSRTTTSATPIADPTARSSASRTGTLRSSSSASGTASSATSSASSSATTHSLGTNSTSKASTTSTSSSAHPSASPSRSSCSP